MQGTITRGSRAGTAFVPSSKSIAHRLLITAALSDRETTLSFTDASEDIDATIDCLKALGASAERCETSEGRNAQGRKTAGYTVHPITEPSKEAVLPCRESGSTLRFLLPLAGALGTRATFAMEGRLPERPHGPFLELLSSHGMSIEKSGNTIRTEGKLRSGRFTIPGNISSQFISGLLFALPLLEGESTIEIEGSIESEDYITMTEKVMADAGFNIIKESRSFYRIPGGQRGTSKGHVTVEADWSGAAFFLCMGAFSEKGILVPGLSPASCQGDRRILDVLRSFGANVTADTDGICVKKGSLRGTVVDGAAIPDLIPAISALAACAEGTTTIKNAGRLRFKESDRLTATAALITSLGGKVKELPDGLIITGQPRLSGGTVDSFDDHRIAMASAILSAACDKDITVLRPECVRKSFPSFFEVLDGLEVET